MTTLIETIRSSVIGERTAIPTPFGHKPLVYADYTASGRSLHMIEDFIRDRVQPYYANTHTETSYTGAQTTALREQAREQIRRALNGSTADSVIFCGSGATAAIHKLIDILNLRLPADLNDRYCLEEAIPETDRPVVFVGPYEHHSNDLPWRESIARVVRIPLTAGGQLDMAELETQLLAHRHHALRIGSFSAASNVTGLKTDTGRVTGLLHRHGALACWDYAAAGPYVGIDMTDMDAVFLSPHKFIGGPGTPGVLAVKKALLGNRVPSVPGGGTVAFVSADRHRYLDHPERREEGGTPGIIEAIRAGLVFKLQQAVGTDVIETREASFLHRARARWTRHDNLRILGPVDAPSLSIISLQVLHRGKPLHYGFVVALLNDLFGIQARGGCSCAGPYGHSLLGIDPQTSQALDEQIAAGHAVLRPGWVRLNFNYFIDEDTFEYLLRAVELVAEHGWRLLPCYALDSGSQVWRYQGRETPLLTGLDDLDFEASRNPAAATAIGPLSDYLDSAEACLRQHAGERTPQRLSLPEAAESLRWFSLAT